MAPTQCYTLGGGRKRPAEERAGSWRELIADTASQGGERWAGPLLTSGLPVAPPDWALPTPVFVLLLGVSLLAGFVIGMTVEFANLQLRERQLARGRRLLASQAGGLRRQLIAFYQLRDGATNGVNTLPEPPRLQPG